MAMLAASSGTGCGAFVTEAGIFPLPTIHLVYPVPAQVGIAFETVLLDSPSGPMFGWFIPAEGASATILIHHGAITNRSQYLAHYVLLHEMGYHVFIYDYQGFGENFNVATIGNILGDADRALQHLQQRDEPGTEKIVIFGLSMGTLPSMAQAARSPDRVVGVMFEGSFVQETLPPFSYLALGIVPSPLAYTRMPAALDPETNVAAITLPKLFLQSRDDFITPFDSATELYDRAPPPKAFVPLSGLHTYSVIFDLNYGPSIKAFLDTLTKEDNARPREGDPPAPPESALTPRRAAQP